MNNNIDIRDFDYILPEERIAKYPLLNRDTSQMLINENGNFFDDKFYNLSNHLPKQAALYFNNTKVLYARLLFKKNTGANIEIFCLEPYLPEDYSENLSQRGSCKWKCLVGNLKKWKEGVVYLTNDDKYDLEAEIVNREADFVVIAFSWNDKWTFSDILVEAGRVPIPPYLNRPSEESDKKSYQTLYSKIDGSVAAPTAGLHFTSEVLDSLNRKGINQHAVTLHVGAGTFRPISANDVSNHIMHQEYAIVERNVIESLQNDKQIVYAVGTTTVRTLESLYWVGVQLFNINCSQEKIFYVRQWEPYETDKLPSKKEVIDSILKYMDNCALESICIRTSIIIVPGYKPKIVQGLITNFHQPRSTLLLLLASFVGNCWKEMYQHALDNNYRFLSYGDSCLIQPRIEYGY